MFHSLRAPTYLMHLVLARHTVQLDKFQVRPMKVGQLEKGMSFEVFQGISRLLEMQLMSLML